VDELVRRASEVTALVELLTEEAPGVRICSISGPGGVGKSYLLEHVLAEHEPGQLGYLVLSANGSNTQNRGDFLALIDGQLLPQSLPPPAPRGKDYFPHGRDIAAIHRRILESASAEISASKVSDEVKEAALSILRAGRVLNRLLPRTRDYFSFTGVRDSDVKHALEVIDTAWDLAARLRALEDTSVLPGVIRDLVGVTKKNRIKRDLFNVLAEAIVTDATAALSGYRAKDALALTHAPVGQLHRLLIILDDFEVIGPLLNEFLVGALIPRLAEAPFGSLLIVLGRDALDVTHPGWAQHCHKYLRASLRVDPFTSEQARALLSQAGVPESEHQRFYDATQGFPFLLSLAAEEHRSGIADSVMFLRKFYDRTTRWMTPEQEEWLMQLVYLDQINEDTIRVMLPGASPDIVQSWFEREASIRDPTAKYWRVRPILRDKLLKYSELRSPARHAERVAQARLAGSGST